MKWNKRKGKEHTAESVSQVVIRKLVTRKGKKGQLYTVASLAVKRIFRGKALRAFKVVRPGPPPKYVTVGATGVAQIVDWDFIAAQAEEEPQPSTQAFNAVGIWIWTGIANAPGPPGESPTTPKPIEPDPEPPEGTKPPADNPDAPTPPTPPDGGIGGGGIDTGIGGINDVHEWVELLCEGDEDCVADMLDFEKELKSGGPDDPEEGGFTGGRDTGEQDTGDQFRSW
jgi:hypothetical protein